MPRFFVDAPLVAGATLALPETVVRHAQVLRLQPGDALTLFNGVGPAFSATLAALGKKHALALTGTPLADDASEPPYRITLVQGIASNEKMDWLIEKAVELGVSDIVPVAGERSVVRLDAQRRQRRHAHWIALARAACEQCGRNRVPTIAAPLAMRDWLAAGEPRDHSLNVLLSPRATPRFASLPAMPPHGRTALLIGPEGGWSEAEEQQALAAGCTAISLGARVLRTETAGLALLAALAARWGGW